MIERSIGMGTLAYLAALLDPERMHSTLSALSAAAGVRPAFGALPPDVEVCRRVGAGHEVFILINHSATGRLTRRCCSPG